MIKALIYIAVLIFAISISSCTSKHNSAEPTGMATNCTAPRPEACTADYQPVCATRDNGVRCVTTPCESTEMATYSNSCSACADNRVFEYQDGACADENR